MGNSDTGLLIQSLYSRTGQLDKQRIHERFDEIVAIVRRIALPIACNLVFRSSHMYTDDDVDDVLAEVYIRVYFGLVEDKFTPDPGLPHPFEAWIARIAHNTAINWLKRQRHHSDIDKHPGIKQPAFDTTILSHLDVKTKVKQVLRKATPRQREIVLLLLQGESILEIAEALGVTRSAVYSHMSQLATRVNPNPHSDSALV